jgi:hypothetical protein
MLPTLLVSLAALAIIPCKAADWRQSAVQIELRPRVLVPTGEVRLGDVAIIRTSDLHAIQSLSNLSLGTAPQAGAGMWLSRDGVARWLRSQLGVLRTHVQWSGAVELHVIGSPAASPRMEGAAAAPAGVRRGEWVSLRMVSGELRIESRAQASSDAGRGEVVNVRTVSAPNLILARVIGPGRVEAVQ